MELATIICVKIGNKLVAHVINNDKPLTCNLPHKLRKKDIIYTIETKYLKLINNKYYSVKYKHLIIDNFTYKIYEHSEKTCVVCLTYNRNILFKNCGHYICCKQCYDSIMCSSRKCPVCRAEISIAKVMKPFSTEFEITF